MKILAVDDDQHFLDLLVAVLSDAGYRDVSCAGSAEEALTIALSVATDFDCFLLDVAMPDVDGVELCEKLRATTRYRATPIIMVTALHQKSLVRECFDAGATDFLNKPLDGLELGARIRIARMLNDSLNAKNTLTVDELSVMELTDGDAHEAEDLSAMEKVPGLTNSHAIENHMLRNQSGYFILHVLGFTVPGFGAMSETLAPRECSDVLCDSAQAIAKSLENYQYSFAYLGGGRFIGLVQGRRFWSTANVIEEIVQNLRVPRANVMNLHGATVEVTSLSEQRFWTALQTADAVRAYRNPLRKFDPSAGSIAQADDLSSDGSARLAELEDRALEDEGVFPSRD